MADVFISYAREDHSRAGQLAAALGKKQLSVWWDHEILTGKTFDETIEQELEIAKSVVVLWSANSVKSEWVKNEAAAAVERDVLVPVLIDRVKLPLEFRRRQTADLIEWHGDPDDPAFIEVCRAVTANTDRIQSTVDLSTPGRDIRQRLLGGGMGTTVRLAIAVVIAIIIGYAFFMLFPKHPGSADVYIHPRGSFERQGGTWVEFPPYSPGKYYSFKESHRDDKFIYLYDENRHKENDPSRIMYLRLPIAGGMAEWSYPNPFIWQALYPVSPKQN